MMNVKVQTTIRLSETPDFVSEQIDKITSELRNVVFLLDKANVRGLHFGDTDLEKDIDSARKTLAFLDMCLEDLANVSAGYIQFTRRTEEEKNGSNGEDSVNTVTDADVAE
jgi:hypothetical protein